MTNEREQIVFENSVSEEVEKLFEVMNEVIDQSYRRLTSAQNIMSREEWNEIFDSIKIYNALKATVRRIGIELDAISKNLEIIKYRQERLIKLNSTTK